MTWKQRRAAALQHFGLAEADIVETVRVHKPDLSRVFHLPYCPVCDRVVPAEECEYVKMKQGRLILVNDKESV